ncbi:Nn.00g109800.m01.CDS01 [Neocucurbitaria sp. VM-36]
MADKDKMAKYRTEIQQVSKLSGFVSHRFPTIFFLQWIHQKDKDTWGLGLLKFILFLLRRPILEFVACSGDDLHMHLFKI